MFRRSNKRKSELDNSIENKPKQATVQAPEEATAQKPEGSSGKYEYTMSREEFIMHNEDARKVYEDIKRLRQSVENLKKTGADKIPEEIENSSERIQLKETEAIVAAKQAILEQAKRDYLEEKARKVEAARKEQEAMARQMKVIEAQKRAALVEEEAERKRKEAEEAERRAKETARMAALEAMDAARKAKEEAGLINSVKAKPIAEAETTQKEKPKAEEIEAELEQAKKQLLIAQRQQEAKLDRISQVTEAHTTKLAETQQEILEQQQELIKSGQEEVAAVLDEHKEARLERLTKEEQEKILRKQRALEEKRRREEQAKALKAEKLAKAQAVKAEKLARAKAEKEEKRIREEKKRAERLRKAEERELLRKAKKDAEAKAKLERLRLEAKSLADAEMGGGIVNVQGMTINTAIKEIPHISWRDLFNIKSKKERQTESATERHKLAKERKKRTEAARKLLDHSWRKRLLKYEKTKFARKFRKFKIYCEKNKVRLLTVFAIVLIAVVGTAGVFNYYTAYAYSYNGKTLGIVKEKDDVLRITDLVQGALTEDKNVEVVIDAKNDIKFERVTTLGDVEIDTSEDVLKRLTYMGDLNVKAFGIYINGKKVGAVESKDVAAEVMQEIKDKSLSGMEDAEVEEAVFIEDVEVKKGNTDLQDVSTKDEMVDILCADRETTTFHEVAAGETLSDIAKLYSIKEEDLIADNEGVSPKNLTTETRLVVKKNAPILTVKITEKVTYDKVVKYEVVKKDSKEIYEGYTELKRKGENGLTEITSRIVLVNGKQIEEIPLETTVKKEPVSKVILVGVKERPPSVGSGKYIWPFEGGYTLTSGFKYRWGRLHEGIDLGTPSGNNVLAADGGVVTYAGYSGAYGYLIKIDHQNGMETRYAHNSSLLVSTGDKVFQGMHIAESGNTGRSTGPHLHFEIRVGGVPKDPLGFLP